MADLLTNEKERRKKVLLFGALVIIAVLLLSTGPMLEKAQTMQEHFVSNEMGSHAKNTISAITWSWFAPTIKSATTSVHANFSSSFVVNRAGVALTLAYIVVWRAVYFFGLLFIVSPLFVAAIIDGLVRRRIGQWCYEYTSTARHYMARTTVGWSIDALILCAVLPIPIPPVLLLSWYILIGINLRWWTASMQKRI